MTTPQTARPSAGELYQQALVELDVDRLARNAGVIDQPPSNSATIDANERQFIAYFSNKLRDRRAPCEKRLAQYGLDRTASGSKIDIGQTRASLAGLYNSIEPDLARAKQDHQQDLERAKDDEARALRYLRHFQAEHQLQNRAAEWPSSRVKHFGVVGIFAVLEWISLSIFYAEGSDFGLLGGTLMAMALSMINIVLAVLIGAVLRYLNHKSLPRKILAILAAVGMAGLFLFATGFAAHYRNAVADVAASHSQSPQQTQGQLADRKGATSTDDEQWRASKLAWEHFREDGFVFRDVLSWLLIILAILFGIIAAWKGYGIDDMYPGYGPISRRYKELSAVYEDSKRKYTDTVDRVFTLAGEKQQALLWEVRKLIEDFQELASKSETEANGFAEFARAAQQACSDVVFRYRQVNREVATSAAPRYFADPVGLDAALMGAPQALTEIDRTRLSEYVGAIREFTDVVQRDDTKRQQMRTHRISMLAQFFEGIERAINDKLAREAETYKS